MRYRVRFGPLAGRGRNSEEFGWARIGSEALLALADPLGYVPRQMWTADGRRFVALSYSG